MSIQNVVACEPYKGRLITITHESDPVNPRTEYENKGKMICFHNRYTLGDKHSYSNPREFVQDITDAEAKGPLPNDDLARASRLLWLPLYLYDHSGITMKTSPFTCPWDSGQVGVIYITYDQIAEDMSVKWTGEGLWEPSEQTREAYTKILEAEVSTYDSFIRGDVMQYSVVGPNDEEAHEDDEHPLPEWSTHVEYSCGGYYGEEAAMQAAKEYIDAVIVEG